MLLCKKEVRELIVKRRSINYNYIGLERLYQRLPENHHMKIHIHSKMLAAKAGIKGEEIVERIFEKYQFPFNNRVLHDVSLSSNGLFQIDTLFISKSQVVIIECKNIVGELSFESNPPCLVRSMEGGNQDTFESPEVQLERNIYLLKEWLERRNIRVPVKGVIVFSNRKSKIVLPPKNIDVIYATSIPTYLRYISSDQELMSDSQLDNLAQIILQSHQTYYPYPMGQKWGIDLVELKSGVQCVNCGKYGMERVKRTWQCNECLYKDKDAHVKTIHEWFVLVSDQISNRDCCKFLHIKQHQTASRILHQMDLMSVGISRGTRYEMSKEMLYGHKNLYVDTKNSIRT